MNDQPVAVGAWRVPELVEAIYPEVGHRWAWLSALRLRGDGLDSQGVALVAVNPERTDAVGRWVTPAEADTPEFADRTYGKLLVLLMTRAGQRMACEDGTPARSERDPLHCVWCGKSWDVHHGDGTP